jgi:hypothetical protein
LGEDEEVKKEEEEEELGEDEEVKKEEEEEELGEDEEVKKKKEEKEKEKEEESRDAMEKKELKEKEEEEKVKKEKEEESRDAMEKKELKEDEEEEKVKKAEVKKKKEEESEEEETEEEEEEDESEEEEEEEKEEVKKEEVKKKKEEEKVKKAEVKKEKKKEELKKEEKKKEEEEVEDNEKKEINEDNGHQITNIYHIHDVADFVSYINFLFDDSINTPERKKQREKHGDLIAEIIYDNGLFQKSNGDPCEHHIPDEDRDMARKTLEKMGIKTQDVFKEKIKTSTKTDSRNVADSSQTIHNLKKEGKENGQGQYKELGQSDSSGTSGNGDEGTEKHQISMNITPKAKMTFQDFIASEISGNSGINDKSFLGKDGAKILYDRVKSGADVNRAEQLKTAEKKFDNAVAEMEKLWNEFDRDNGNMDKGGDGKGDKLLYAGKKYFTNVEKLVDDSLTQGGMQSDDNIIKRQNDIKNFYALVSNEMKRLATERNNDNGGEKLSREEEIRQQIKIRNRAFRRVMEGRGEKINETGRKLYDNNKVLIEGLEREIEKKDRNIEEMLKNVDRNRKNMRDVIEGNTKDIARAMIANLKGGTVNRDLSKLSEQEQINLLEQEGQMAMNLEKNLNLIKDNLRTKVSKEPLWGENRHTAGSPRTIDSYAHEQNYGPWADRPGEQLSQDLDGYEPKGLEGFLAEKMHDYSKISDWHFSSLSVAAAAKLYEKAKAGPKGKQIEKAEKEFNTALNNMNGKLEELNALEQQHKKFFGDPSFRLSIDQLISKSQFSPDTTNDITGFYTLVNSEMKTIKEEKEKKNYNKTMSEEDKLKQEIEIRTEAFKRVKRGSALGVGEATNIKGKGHYKKYKKEIDKIEAEIERANSEAIDICNSIEKHKKIMNGVISGNANDITGAMINQLKEATFVLGSLTETQRTEYIETEHKLRENLSENRKTNIIKNDLKKTLRSAGLEKYADSKLRNKTHPIRGI